MGLRNRTEFVYFELWQNLTAKYGYTPEDIVTFIEGAGYTSSRITQAGEVEPIGPGAQYDRLENYLAGLGELPPDVIAGIRAAHTG